MIRTPFYSKIDLRHLMTIWLLGGLVFAKALSEKLVDCDLWWHMFVGKYIVQTHKLPQANLFSHTAPENPWVASAWLSDILFYVLYKHFGPISIILLKSLVLTVTFGIIFKLSLKASAGLWHLSVMIVGLGALGSMCQWTERPQLFTWLLLSCFYYLICLYKEDTAVNQRLLLFALPPLLMMLWTNLHGGFVAGTALVLLFAVSQSIKACYQKQHLEQVNSNLRKIWLMVALVFLAMFLNPYSYRAVLVPFKLMTGSFYLKHIDEWQSPNFHEPFIALGYGGLLVLSVLAFSLSKRRLESLSLLLFLTTACLSLASVRHLMIFVIISAPIIAKQFASLNLSKALISEDKVRQQPRGAQILLHWLFAFSLIALIVSVAPLKNTYDTCVAKNSFPQSAITYLRSLHNSGFRGNLFNLDRWGSCVLWELYPKYKVFVDTRWEAYSADLGYKYLKAHKLQAGWEKVLEDHKIAIILWQSQSPLAELLTKGRSRQRWHRIYCDEVASIFVKKGVEPTGGAQHLAQEH